MKRPLGTVNTHHPTRVEESGSSELAIVQRFVIEKLLSDDQMTIAPDEALFSSGLLSSLLVTELIVFLEDEFEIRIESAEVVLEDFDTAERIVNLVSSLRRKSQAG